jgi:hypothetical protein
MEHKMSYQKFDEIAATKILFYVYALRDPRDKKVFYIGKGQKNRWFDHIEESQKKKDDPSLKLGRIREIENAGLKVEAFIIRSGIPTEKAAYEVEGAVIHAFRLLEHGGSTESFDLTNLAEVHHPEKGLVSVDVAQSLFNAPRAPEIDVPCAMFRIPRLWFPEMSDEELREATSGWWAYQNVKTGMKVAEYAFAVSKGIIRGVYGIDESMWRERREGDRDYKPNSEKKERWGFPDCKAAPELSHYLNTSVKHLFKKGDANAVRFFNCN